jgi:site-specific recombinase XerD
LVLADGRLTHAVTDQDAIAAWLAKIAVNGSNKTLESYRKEVRRLLSWMEWRKITLEAFGVEAAAAYVKFLGNPQPLSLWVGPRRPLGHPDWKPFAGPLSAASIRQSRLILGSLFTFLAASGYLKGNPFKLLGRARAPERRVHERVLYDTDLQALEAELRSMPRDTERERMHYHRCRWVFYLVVLTGMRRAEIAKAVMGDVRHRRVNGEDQWTITVTGKGGKTRDVPIPDQLLDELKVYRISVGLPELPTARDRSPLLRPITRTGNNLSDKAVYLLVRQLFENAARTARDDGNPELADRLDRVSTHWLRHTNATLQIEAGTSLEMVQDNLGHASIHTTRGYVHVDPSRRYKAARGLKV